MALLYLVRHASAEERDATRWPDDALRPLSERGARRFSEAARGLRGLGVVPEVVLSSPHARAAQTAALLEAHAGWPAATAVMALASGSLVTQVEVLRGYHTAEAVGVVGHEPDLSRLASWLLAGDDVAVAFDWRRGGIAMLELVAPAPGSAQMVAYLPPRALRR